MAKIYGEISSSALMTFDKSFARANGQPLDSTEVYYSLEAAKTYAAGAGAYIGQIIAVIENNTVTHYSIESVDGTLAPIGSSAVGDNKTIVVNPDGTISLKDINGLVFERDIVDENNEPTGEKEKIQYQPLMTERGLIWVEPSKTTAEGLAILVEALSNDVTSIKNTLDNDVYTKSETDEKIAEAVEKKIHMATKVVESVPTVDEAEANIIYLVPDEKAGAGIYIEYILVELDDGTKSVEAIGSTAINLNDYYTKTEIDNSISGVLTKVQEVEDSLDSTNVTVVKINAKVDEHGTKIDALEAYYAELGIATSEKAGLVVASKSVNTIDIDETGVMSVNSINVNKLVQDEDDELILNGGNA